MPAPRMQLQLAKLSWLGCQIRKLFVLLEKRGQTKFTENTITERQGLIEALRLVRRYGFALDNEEFLPGVMSVGTALRDYSGTVLGSLGCTFPHEQGVRIIWRALKLPLKIVLDLWPQSLDVLQARQMFRIWFSALMKTEVLKPQPQVAKTPPRRVIVFSWRCGDSGSTTESLQ